MGEVCNYSVTLYCHFLYIILFRKELPSETEVVTTLEVTVEVPLATEATTTEKKETKSVTTTAEEIVTKMTTTTKSTLGAEGTSTSQPQGKFILTGSSSKQTECVL